MTIHSKAVSTAVVFAYHDIGVRCLDVLLELGFEIKLVVTHQDSKSEKIWFDSVQDLAQKHGLPVITPDDANTDQVIEQVAKCAPEFIFSFYYRQMLGQALLDIPVRGAFNLHGSLLPKYRGRVPVNWAIINGEKETGVSLHRMEIRPDAGNLLAQAAISILRNDTAHAVFQKLTCAAENLLIEVLPEMLEGRIIEMPLDLEQGSYFSGRKPEDGLIDWHLPAEDIHNLIRAVAPPYPGAFFHHESHTVEVLGSYFRAERACFKETCIYVEKGQFQADCSDGQRFMITQMVIDGEVLEPAYFESIFGPRLVPGQGGGL